MTQATGDLTINIVQFTSQTEELNRLLIEFSKILDEESSAIRSNHTEELQSVLSQKQNTSEKLNTTSERVEKLLAQHSVNIISLTDSELFTTFPEQLKQNIVDIISLVQHCHDKNLANGMSIQALSTINKHALDLISGKNPQDVKLYGAKGEKTPHASSGTTLGKA